MWSLLLLLGCHASPDTTTCAQKALTPECVNATNEPDCVANGGCWGTGGLSPEPICTCPTSDAGQPCTTDDDCEGVCVGPASDTGCEPTGGTCAPATPRFGCYCAVFEGGFASLCVD